MLFIMLMTGRDLYLGEKRGKKRKGKKKVSVKINEIIHVNP